MKIQFRVILTLTVVLLLGCRNPVTPPADTVYSELDYASTTIGTLKYIPAGRFQRDEKNTNISEISEPFRMSEHEITRAQFAAILTIDPSDTRFSSGTNDPVQKTNWYHAIAFCNKLSISEGFTPVYSINEVNFNTLTYGDIPTNDNAEWNATTAIWTNNGYRLPTEMEWMWAAMGATGIGVNTTGYLKAFAGSTGSNNIGDFAVYGYGSGESGATTTARSNPVGSKTSGANELGLYDMSGNVWEWCWDWRWYLSLQYPDGILTDYQGATSGQINHALRGGSFGSSAANCTVAFRSGSNPYYQYDYIGFRVVRR
jgi:formylglycine-generating enzyme required for sulfatase activity